MEGGNSNDYEYAAGDPINGFDLTGRKRTCSQTPGGSSFTELCLSIVRNGLVVEEDIQFSISRCNCRKGPPKRYVVTFFVYGPDGKIGRSVGLGPYLVGTSQTVSGYLIDSTGPYQQGSTVCVGIQEQTFRKVKGRSVATYKDIIDPSAVCETIKR